MWDPSFEGEIALMFAGKGWVVGIWLVEKLSSEQVRFIIHNLGASEITGALFGDFHEILSGLLKFQPHLPHSSLSKPLFSSCWRD